MYILYKCRQRCVYALVFFLFSPPPVFALSSFVCLTFSSLSLVRCLRPATDTALWLAEGWERSGVQAPVLFFQQEAQPCAQFRSEPLDGSSLRAALVNVLNRFKAVHTVFYDTLKKHE